MKPSLYIETTIPSFLVGTMSPVLVTAGHQALTQRWWEEERDNYRLYVSSLVEHEINKGKSSFAAKRRILIAVIQRLDVTPEVLQLAESLHSILHLPLSAKPDATHLAVTSYYKVDYLLTWNMKHLANGHVRHALQKLHDSGDHYFPTICTPEELIEEKFA